jgi:general secretion pathway protein G
MPEFVINSVEASQMPRVAGFARAPRSPVHRKARRGFTLLEIIVVVTIIAILATMVAPKLIGNIGKAKTKVARSEVSQLASQFGIYLADHGMSRPSDDTALSVLTPDYVKAADLKDPWGRDYLLLIPGVSGEQWDIVSYGADGQPGGDGEDRDVNNNVKE